MGWDPRCTPYEQWHFDHFDQRCLTPLCQQAESPYRCKRKCKVKFAQLQRWNPFRWESAASDWWQISFFFAILHEIAVLQGWGVIEENLRGCLWLRWFVLDLLLVVLYVLDTWLVLILVYAGGAQISSCWLTWWQCTIVFFLVCQHQSPSRS